MWLRSISESGSGSCGAFGPLVAGYDSLLAVAAWSKFLAG
jgi:hypothetical protein